MQKLTLLIGALAFALIAGCGGDDDDTQVDAGGNSGAPVAAFTMDKACTNSSSDPVGFTSASTDPDSDTLSCSWTFASGTPSSSSDCNVTGVTFPNQAPYQVNLTVNDGNGGTDSITQVIAPC